MTNRKFILKIVGAVIIIGGGFTCAKYKDPTAPEITLTNHYCNDPDAVNYNWGFPGIADDSVCYYPDDLYTGNWQMTDSVINSDSVFQGNFQYSLVLTATEDTTRTHLALSGLCSGGGLVNLIVTKYGQGATDSLIPDYSNYQYLCSQSDTIFGTFNKDSYDSTVMDIEYTVLSPSGTTYHFARAVKN